MPSRRGSSRRWRGLAASCRVLAVATLAATATAEVMTVERILAVVDGRPLLLSEVDFVAGLRGLDPRAALEALIDERLMLREARRLPQAAVTAEEEEAAYASLVSKFGSLPPAQAEDLRRLARREAAILKYVEFRFRPQVRVSDEQVQRAYATEYEGVKDPPPFETVADRLRARLAAADLDQKIEAWVAELRISAEIRHNSGP